MPKLFFSLIIFIWMAAACAAPTPLPTLEAQQRVQAAWQAEFHAVWDLTWPAAPAGGPLTVEMWQSGPRYRLEILEAVPAALVGEALVFDGKQGWRYNRFDPPASFRPVTPALAPVTEALALPERLLSQRPQTATQAPAQVDGQPALELTLSWANGDTLTAWLAQESGLPLRLSLTAGRHQLEWRAREIEPLPDPPEGLFTVGPWLY